MATTVKVVLISTPLAAPVKATQVAVLADHPALAPSHTGGLALPTATGIVILKSGDYVVEDGMGGYKGIPKEFFNLFYKITGN